MKMHSRPLSETECDLVATAPLFSALGKQIFRSLIVKCRVERRAVGEYLFQAGDVAEHLYFLLSGKLRLVKISAHGEETVMHFLTRPGAFAEAVSLAGAVYPVNCQVMEECEVVLIPREACIALLRETPKASTDVLVRLIEWERFFLGELYQLRHTTPLQRIASFLIDFEGRSSAAKPNGSSHVAYPEKRQIASLIGVTPETFSRSLRKLEAAGAIAKGTHLKILDRKILEQSALNAS